MATLAATPGQLAELALTRPPMVLVTRPAPGEWSVADILGHLHACQDTWGPWIRRIVTEDRPSWRDMSARATMRGGAYLGRPFAETFAPFRARRADLLALLGDLRPEGWARVALVRRAGRSDERSVHHYADRLATHEALHLREVYALLGRI